MTRYSQQMLYGRAQERLRIEELLDGARSSRSGALVIRGEPGIGKTALLQSVRSGAPDLQVLSARGVESERHLAFAGLHQLLLPAMRLVDRLPEPQARSLSGALGLSDATSDSKFLTSAACLSLLAELAEEKPVVCIVDDAQWLDTPSVDALLFVARRTEVDGIVMLFASRDDEMGPGFEARGVPSLTLTGIDKAAAAEIVRSRVSEVAAYVRDRLIQRANGNPLALVELPASLSEAQLSGREALPERLPLSPDVQALFLSRVRRLPEDTQRLLTVAAIDGTGLLAPVLAAAGTVGIDAAALDAAELSGLIEVDGSRFELKHPLVRSALYQASTSRDRRAAHLALADALADPSQADQRAWHRAAAALGPDASAANDLEDTADAARRRGGHAAAADALERAAVLTAESVEAARRYLAAATAAWHAGQPARATALLDQARPDLSEPAQRVDLEHLSGTIQFRCGSVLDARHVLLAAADEASELSPQRAVEILFDVGLAGIDAGDYALVAEAGRRAAALPRTADKSIDFLADLIVSVGSLCEGKTAVEVPLVLDVVARSDGVDDPRWLIWAAAGAGLSGMPDREAEILARASTIARTSGAVDLLTYVLVTYAVNGVVGAQLRAISEASEGLTLAREAGLTNAATIQQATLAWFAAVSGNDEICESAAAEATTAGRINGEGLGCAIAEWAVALRDLSLGRVVESTNRLAALRAAPVGLSHPLVLLMSTPDFIEASVRAGDVEQAQSAYAILAGFATPGAPPWAVALAARSRALLTDDATDAEAEYMQALTAHEEAPRPFDQARSQLLLGEHLRRARRRVDARKHLRTALEQFEFLGAAHWAERAKTELRASGETARRRDMGIVSQLSPQELQVARFVADGLSNKEVAAQLMLSPRTIDAHLRSIFSKLGITSRTELARVNLEAPEPVGVSPV